MGRLSQRNSSQSQRWWCWLPGVCCKEVFSSWEVLNTTIHLCNTQYNRRCLAKELLSLVATEMPSVTLDEFFLEESWGNEAVVLAVTPSASYDATVWGHGGNWACQSLSVWLCWACSFISRLPQAPGCYYLSNGSLCHSVVRSPHLSAWHVLPCLFSLAY